MLYLAGAVLALGRTDAAWSTRVAVAAFWPLGPLAFVVTVSLLVTVSLFVFPVFGLLAAAGVAAWAVWG